MVLKNTNQLLSNGGEALFAAVYDSPYFYIYNKISKEEKWGKYMHDVENLKPKFSTWPNVTDTYAKKVDLVKNELQQSSIYSPYWTTSHNLLAKRKSPNISTTFSKSKMNKYFFFVSVLFEVSEASMCQKLGL